MPKNTIVILIIILLANTLTAQTTVAIIGGGMAGISSAHYILQYDSTAKITIYEKEKVIGGNAKTVEVFNVSQQKIKVDIGPQYFIEGPWNDYIEFLNETLGETPYNFESLSGSLLIQHQGEKNPHFITPHKLNFRGEKLSNLIKFKRFNNLAYKLYKNPAEWKGVSIENWYNQIPLPLEYKKRIVYPFLAASLGTSVSEIKSTSALDIVKLFAFRKPKLSNKFKIMTEGMGTLIQQVGVELRKQGVEIKTESPVYQITKQGTKWLVKYVHNATEHSQLVDFVITTAHADQNIKLLNNEPSLSQVVYHLQQLKYFEAKIVLHSDTSFINTKKPAFLNIMTNQKHEIVSSTMNLSMISPRLNGIYKSWLSQNDIDKLNASKKILHIASFYHPLITPEFISHLDTLHQHLKKISNFYIGGGWSEGLETQNSAVVSGKHALDKYKIFIGGTYAIKE